MFLHPTLLIAQIGEGGYSVVKKVTLKNNNKQAFAAKIIAKKTLTSSRERRALHEEITTLQVLDHPSIIRFHHAFEEKSQYYLVTDLMTGGSLSDHIASKKDQFKEADVSYIMSTLLDAVAYCHSHGIVHRDLKLENILLVVRL